MQSNIINADGLNIQEYNIKFNFFDFLIKDGRNLETYVSQVVLSFFEDRYDIESLSQLYVLLAEYYENKRRYKDAHYYMKKLYMLNKFGLVEKE